VFIPVLFGIFLIIPVLPLLPPAHADQAPLNALYLLQQPLDYESFDLLVKSFKDTGADTIIIRPVSASGVLDRSMLAKAVFFAHGCGLKLFVLLPTKGACFLLEEHPEWQDMRYDFQNGKRQPAGSLDLFSPYVMVSLTDLFRDVAQYSIDGVILDEDYYYGDMEGMSDLAMARYKRKYDTSFPFRKSLKQVKGALPQEHAVDSYGEAFWNLAELKKARLLLLLQNIIQASRAVNKKIKFGLAVHVPGLFLTDKELLAWYSHDVAAFQKMDISFFWLAIPHQEIRAQQDINYKKSIETVSRLAVSSLALVNDPAKVVIAIQTLSMKGTSLSLSEIEEVSRQVRRSGEAGIALMVGAEERLPPELTRKIFKR
jgi:hypothetical protein